MTIHVVEIMIVYSENWIIIDCPIRRVEYPYILAHLTDIVTHDMGQKLLWIQ